MGDYETVISIAGFFVISWLVLVMGGGGSYIFNLPAGTTPPELFPSPVDSQIQPVDLKEDAFDYENISFVNSSSLSNPSAAYSSDTVVVVENSSSQGYIDYNLPGIKYVETVVTKNCGGFFGDSGVGIGSGQNTTGFDNICNINRNNVEESGVSFVRFRLDSSDYRTPRVYSFNYSENSQSLGGSTASGGGLISFAALADFFARIGDVVLYPVRLWDYFEHFPIYMRLFYGTLLAWMVVDIAQIG